MSAPSFLFLMSMVLLAPHLTARTANKYAAVCLVSGLVFWGIEIAIS